MPNRITTAALALLTAVLAACSGESGETRPDAEVNASGQTAEAGARFTVAAGEPFEDTPEETHLRNVRQLTFEGENAEAYFSPDGTRLIFQRTELEPDAAEGHGGECDRIWTMDLATGATELVSTGTGRTTCSYFYPGGDRIIYASTHHVSEQCPAPPNMSMGYVWGLYDSYDLWIADADGSNLQQLTETEGYDAEATISPVGDRMVFTSVRDGDLELYTMNLDGSDVQRITNRPGYDGGAFFSPDGSKIVWRASYPEGEELADYQALLAQGLIRPNALEVYVANADGSDVRQVTDNGAANFGPFWHPDGERIIFSSNMDDPTGREFDLYMIHEDGTGLERITYTGDFDGFPMFSPDGRYLVWGSNRNPSHEANTNIFIAEWVE
jgi:Tol biopolymer transport system component